MPSLAYINQSAPFWDWVANLEQEGVNHPWFSQAGQNQEADHEHGEHGHHPPPPFSGPWSWGFPGFGGRGFPHRGPPGPSPQHENDEADKEMEKEADGDMGNKDLNEKDHVNDNGEGPSKSGSDNEGCRQRGRCGGRRGRQGCGPHQRGGFGPRHGPPFHGRRGWGPWARGAFFGGGPPFNPLAFAAGFLDPETKKKDNGDFTPEADIFDTSASFVIHVSLPGVKKEDVGVNWDAEKSELSIAGVTYRPGDEDFLKTLAMDERKVGPFEKKIRLGTRANPAQVDADGIVAKLEDGVLRVEVPKLGDNGFVEVRKVDVE